MEQDVRRLYQQVAAEMRERIVAGDFALNQRLPAERLLAKEYNVSRPTVREAVIALEIEGLVEVRTGSGVYVVSRTPTGVGPSEFDIGPFELLEARRAVEGECAALAAERITDEQIKRLERHIGAMVGENISNVVGEKADRKFHITIAEGTQNPALVSMVVQLWEIRETSPMLVQTIRKAREGGIQPTIRDHETILEALKRRDPKAAKEAMHAHLSRVIEGLLRMTEAEALDRAHTEAQVLRVRYRHHT